jgi:SAM-dependent methyltransferase
MDAETWDRRYADTELVWSATPNQFVAEELADLAPGRALDLAAGEGRNAIWLARRGWSVTALDFSRVALDKGRQLAGDTPVDWQLADATTWRDPAAYDLAVVAYRQLPTDQRRAAGRAAFERSEERRVG